MKEIERFIAEEANGTRHTISCLQEIRKAQDGEQRKHYKTSNGEFLKAIDEHTFNVLGSGRMLYKNTQIKSIKFNSFNR